MARKIVLTAEQTTDMLDRLRFAIIGKGVKLHLSTGNDESLCGKFVDFRYVAKRSDDTDGRDFCSRCYGAAEKRYDTNRRIAYGAMRDAELDRMTYGGKPYTVEEERRDMGTYMTMENRTTDAGIAILTADGFVECTSDMLADALTELAAPVENVIDVVPGVNGIDLGDNSYNRFIGVRVDENGPYTYGLATAISRAPGMNGTGTTNVRATFGDVVRIEGKRYTITDNRYGATGPRKGNPTLVPVITEPVSGVADCTDCGAHIMVNDVTVPEQCEGGCEDVGFEETGADGYGTVAARIAATGPIILPPGNVVSAIVSSHAMNGEPFGEMRTFAPWTPIPGMDDLTATGTLEKMINHAPETWGIHTLPNGDVVAAWYVGNEIISVFVVERGMAEYRVNARIEIAIPGLAITITEYEGVFLCSADPANLYLSEENEQSIAARYVESREWPATAVAAVRVMHMTHVPW